MRAESVDRPRAHAGGGRLQQLEAENERLAAEARRARAVADGIELGLSAARTRLQDAEAENTELRRRLQRCQEVA